MWNGRVGDFAVSTDPSQGGVGGLVAVNPIQTAILMLLFTDVRVDPTDLRYEMHGDRRGWVGDGFDVRADLGEAPLGSRLWLYRRSVLVTAVKKPTLAAIEADALSALQPLVAQGAAAKITVSGSQDGPAGRIYARHQGLRARQARALLRPLRYPLEARGWPMSVRSLASLGTLARQAFTQSVTGAVVKLWANTFTVLGKVFALLDFEHEQRRAYLYEQIFASTAALHWLIRHGFELGLTHGPGTRPRPGR